MTANSPPYALQAGSHSAQLFRQALSTLLGSAGGIVDTGDYLVTQNGVPNMSVNVAGGVPGGRIWIPGTSSTGPQALYYGYNDATANLAIAASDPTNARIDRVVAQVQDAAYSGVTNSFQLAVVTGTPAGSPVAPSAPASSLSLATLSVAALATTVVTGNITDTRVSARLSTFADTALGVYKVIETGKLANITSSQVASTWGACEANSINQPLAASDLRPAFYFDPADYLASGRTTKLRVRATCAVSGAAPAVTFTVGLYPITDATGPLIPGTVTAGSTVAFASPANSSLNQGNSGDFTPPAAGFYAIGIVTSGTTAVSSNTQIRAALQVRQI